MHYSPAILGAFFRIALAVRPSERKVYAVQPARRFVSMKKFTGVLLGVSLLVGAAGVIQAQEMSGGVQPPPKVIVLYREYLKPASSVPRTKRARVHLFRPQPKPTGHSTTSPSMLFPVGRGRCFCLATIRSTPGKKMPRPVKPTPLSPLRMTKPCWRMAIC